MRFDVPVSVGRIVVVQYTHRGADTEEQPEQNRLIQVLVGSAPSLQLVVKGTFREVREDEDSLACDVVDDIRFPFQTRTYKQNPGDISTEQSLSELRVIRTHVHLLDTYFLHLTKLSQSNTSMYSPVNP